MVFRNLDLHVLIVIGEPPLPILSVNRVTHVCAHALLYLYLFLSSLIYIENHEFTLIDPISVTELILVFFPFPY